MSTTEAEFRIADRQFTGEQLRLRALQLPELDFPDESVTAESKHFPVETDDTIGIEVEMYRAQDIDKLRAKADALGFYTFKDITLSNDGVEVVTPVIDYINVGAYIEKLQELYKYHATESGGGIHIHLSVADEEVRKFLATRLFTFGNLLPDWMQRRGGISPRVLEDIDNYTGKVHRWEEVYPVPSKGIRNVYTNAYGIEFMGMGEESISYLYEVVELLHDLKTISEEVLPNNLYEMGQDEMFKEHKRAKELLLNSLKEWGDETDKKENVIIR